MSNRKRHFSFLTPIKNKLTQKRRNTDKKNTSHHSAEGFHTETETDTSSVSRDSFRLSTNSDSILDFTTTINRVISSNSLPISPITTTTTQEQHHNPKMNPDEFAQLFAMALDNENVCNGLRRAMQPLTDPIEQKLDNSIQRIDNLEISADETASKITTIEDKLEDLEQYSRKNNVRIVGLPESSTEYENTPDKVLSFIYDTMKIDINKYDIGNAHRLGRKMRDTTRVVIVQFSTNLMKQQIMRNRKCLKDIPENIYVNDDLTKTRALLFKETRGCVRNKKLSTTWTRDGIVYAKLHETSQPKRIDSLEDLSKFARQ